MRYPGPSSCEKPKEWKREKNDCFYCSVLPPNIFYKADWNQCPSSVKCRHYQWGGRKAASQAQKSEILLSNIQSCDVWAKLTTKKRVEYLPATYSCVNLRELCTKADSESLLVQALSLKPTLPPDTSTVSILCWQKDLPPPLDLGIQISVRQLWFLSKPPTEVAVVDTRQSGIMLEAYKQCVWLRFCHGEKKVDKMLSQCTDWRKLIRKLQCGSYKHGILLYFLYIVYLFL